MSVSGRQPAQHESRMDMHVPPGVAGSPRRLTDLYCCPTAATVPGEDSRILRFTCKREGDRRGSNPRPSEPQSDALPTELRPPSAQKILPGKGGYAPHPRNSVFLSSFLPSSTILKTLEGVGLSIIAMLPLES